MLMFVWQFLFLNQVCVLKMDKVSLICENFFAILGFLKQYIPNPCWTFMKFDQNLYYMECSCISIRGRGPLLGGLVDVILTPKICCDPLGVF